MNVIVSVMAWISVTLLVIGYFPTYMMGVRSNRGVVIGEREKFISLKMKKVFCTLGFIVLIVGTVYANWGW